MTDEKVIKVLDIYRKKLDEKYVLKRKAPTQYTRLLVDLYFSHCYWMLDEIAGLLHIGSKEKAMRWLGFIQGCLWVLGVYSIDEMRDHNRL